MIAAGEAHRWAGGLSVDEAAGGTVRSEVTCTAAGVHWLEHSFEEGRSRVMLAPYGGAARALTPAGVDVGTFAWEYGGGTFMPTPTGVVYSDRDDHRLHHVAAGGSARPLTPELSDPGEMRFADGSLVPGREWAIFVLERHHDDGQIRHGLAAIELGGIAPPRLLASGADFYMAPSVSPDGTKVAWISWNKPAMPWDETELWCAEIRPERTLAAPRRIAGQAGESILSPRWSPAGQLHWISDRSGWWNIYALGDGGPIAICPERAEYAVAPWQHGRRSFDFLDDGTIVAVRVRDAIHDLVSVAPRRGSAEPLGADATWVLDGHLSCHGSTVAFAGGTPSTGVAVRALDVARGEGAVVAGGQSAPSDGIVVPTPITFTDADGERCHGFWYEPERMPTRGRAPLMLHLHGGPTDAAPLSLDDELQLWTSRGFAVLDLNYSGSTGYGSAYRHRLDGEWGRRDLADCVTAVSSLTAQECVDRERLFVRGASAGGYLTLRCLTETTLFRAGVARCGIGDLAMWREDSHDFESRYVDVIVGPPEDRETYAARSPARRVTTTSAPVLLVHGLADRVVPPGHSAAVADAYRAAGRPYRVRWLDGEPHGLRRRDSRALWLGDELDFIGAGMPATAPHARQTADHPRDD